MTSSGKRHQAQQRRKAYTISHPPVQRLDIERILADQIKRRPRLVEEEEDKPMTVEADLHCNAPVTHRDKTMCKCGIKLAPTGSTHLGIHVCIHMQKS